MSVVVVMAIAGVLGFLDARRRNELMLLQNLGVDPLMVSGIWMAMIVILEIVIRLVPLGAGV